MTIGIFGSTGFIGKSLATYLSNNNQVISYTREDLSLSTEQLANKIRNLDVIINLVGAPIVARRWTKKYKQLIISSRVNTILKIKQSLILVNNIRPLFISASAVGIYKTNIYNDEFECTYAEDFLSEVVKQWENACFNLGDYVSKYLILRFGIVLSPDGGALKQLIKLYKLGLGSVIGRNEDSYPYISLNDALRGIMYLIQTDATGGVYNFVEPVNINNYQFAHALANCLNTKVRFRIPDFLVKLAIGARSEVIMAGQHVYPKKLINLGFKFEDADIVKFLNIKTNKI
jgi:uncharacterized protein